MAIIKCKMCGGDLELFPDSTVAECEYCGSRQTVPLADNDKKLTLFARANRLRAACEFDKAAGIYESIVGEFPEEAEAYWGLVLCKYGIEYVDDPASGKKIPTCHRSSFDSILEDSDFEQACENADAAARKLYREEAKVIEEIRKGIIAVSSKELPYDIFICYKETDENGERTLDSVLAQDIYNALQEKNYRVFFARISLEDKLGQEYEPYIFAALHSARILLAVGTDYDYFNAVWVKNEWSRFLKLMAQDKQKHLIPCYKGIDAYDMPKEFAKLQAQDLGKLGATQDLLRGIEKLLKPTVAAPAPQEQVVYSAASKVDSLMDRGFMALEDGEWDKADKFFEEALNNDAKNGRAYFGKALTLERCRNADSFWNKRKNMHMQASPQYLSLQPNTAHIQQILQQYALGQFVDQVAINKLYEFDLRYPSCVAARQNHLTNEQKYFQNHRILARAEEFATGELAQQLQQQKKALFDFLQEMLRQAQAEEAHARKTREEAYAAHIAQADQSALAIYERGLQRREEVYQYHLNVSKNETRTYQLEQSAKLLASLGDYKDSQALSQHCWDKIRQHREAAREEVARKALLAEKARMARRRLVKRVCILTAGFAVVLTVFLILLVNVFIPSSRYSKAQEKLDAGDFQGAMNLYQELDGYKDSDHRAFLLSQHSRFQEGYYNETIHRILGSGYVLRVQYDTNGGDPLEMDIFDSSYDFHGLSTPAREGYRFDRWEYVTMQLNGKKVATITMRATWTGDYTIEYDLAGGTVIGNPSFYNVDGNAITLKQPIQAGYTFIGWTGTDLTEPTMDVTIPAGSYGDRHYTANWQGNPYTFTLDANGGTVANSSLSATYGSHYTLPTPTREHYRFDGWYISNSNQRCPDGYWKEPGNMQLTARWSPIQYTITYHMDNGINVAANPSTYSFVTDTIPLRDPSRTGCKFLGWYTDSSYKNKITEIPTGSSGNLHLYAKWELITYKITYVLNGGTISGTKKTTFTVNDLPLTLPTATKNNYVFLGWKHTDYNGADITSITSVGDITVYASFMDVYLQMELQGYGSNQYYVVTKYSGTATTVDIPATYKGYPVKGIGYGAFRNCSKITTINIPSTITSIGGSAFSGCTSLKKIVIPNGVTSIEDSTFSGCSSLTSVTIPDSVTFIGESAFAYCTSLTSIELPEKLKTMENYAFAGCSKLKSINIPGTVKEIEYCTFKECNNLETVILNEGLEEISFGAFGCPKLKKLIIPSSVKRIDSDAFDYSYSGTCSNVTFYCRAESMPSGWEAGWNAGRPVVWGYTGN